MRGTFSSLTSPRVSRDAAITGSASFLFPAGVTVPLSGWPPSTTNRVACPCFRSGTLISSAAAASLACSIPIPPVATRETVRSPDYIRSRRSPLLQASEKARPAALACPRAGGIHYDELAMTILTNGRIHTMDDASSVVDTLVVRDGRVAFAGRRSDINAPAAEDVVDLDGRSVLPGLVDAHGHLMYLARARLTLDVGGLESEEGVAGKIADAARRAG